MNKKYLSFSITAIFFLILFVLNISPAWNFDIWFHLKSGEIISRLGIIHHDVFAYTTAGREWFPYEWLFQLSNYKISSLLGMDFLNYFTAFLSALLLFILYRLLREMFHLSNLLAISLVFLFFANTLEFLVSRPQLFAYIFLTTNLYLILKYFFKGKNFLLLTIPITLLWANSHGSIFLDPLFFAGFAAVSILNLALLKDRSWLKKFKILSLYSIITFVLTILPPLGFTQYRLLWIFFKNRETVTRFISEWAPLSTAPFAFYLFTITLISVFILFFYVNFRKKTIKENLWVILLIPFVFSTFGASRNAFLSYLAITLILASVFSQIDLNNLSKKLKLIFVSSVILALIFHAWIISDKRNQASFDQYYYPTQALNFIKRNELKGHMFNEYGYGGYLLYNLYPEQKVYFDGRTDLYLCCEMQDTLKLAYQKNEPDSQYKKLLAWLWDKNQISFVLIRTEKHIVLRKIARILQNDPNWSLVFWDDNSQIFVRRDGKNDEVIEKFGAKAATPYDRNPFKPNALDQAFEEYQRMIKIADSSKSRNTIGYIYLQKGEFDKAKAEFEKAIQVFPYNESPYMNLAELALKDRDPYKAVKLYEKAKTLASDRGLIYIRLGQLILDTYGDKERALNTWKEGLRNTIDTDAKTTLQKLVDNPPNPP